MKILVSVKRVIDASIHIRVKADFSGVETSNAKMSMNPFDEIAIEEAVRLKESGLVNEIVVVSMGDIACQETLRTALAMGADSGLLIQTTQELQPLAVAKLLRHVVSLESPDLVLMGKQAIDDDSNQTGQMLAALLNWPQATFASKITIQDKQAYVIREVDEGLETLRVQLPAVITTDLRLNQPRYISLPNIMKSKQKEITRMPMDDLEVDISPRLLIKKTESPPVKKAGIKVTSVQELINKLKEAHVLPEE